MARLYIQSVRACMTTKRKVKEALERFSRQKYASHTNRTHRAYDEAVRRIDSQNKEYQMIARHALLWITYAERPLDAEELTYALAVEPGKPSFDEDNIPSIEDVVSICAGLVFLDNASGRMRLVHHTAYEYFRDARSDWFPETESAISSSCVTCLSYEILESDNHEPKHLPEFEWSTVLKFAELADPNDSHIDSHRLYKYSATYWGHHARRAGAAAVDACMIKFLDSMRPMKTSWEAMPANDDPRLFLRKRAVTGIHLASYFGIEEAVRQLLSKGTNINQGDGKGWTPLCYAAYSGHESVIRLFLEHDGQVYCSRESISRALYLALKYRHEEVALRLLEKGADVDDCSRGGTPLASAGAKGHLETVRLLIDRGADINAVSEGCGRGEAGTPMRIISASTDCFARKTTRAA